jgi:hypothetical protein
MNSRAKKDCSGIVMLNAIIFFAVLSLVIQSGCGNGNGISGQEQHPAAASINLSGGEGVDGIGGDGGEIDALKGYFGIILLRSGTVDTRFSLPSYSNSVNLGTNPLIIAGKMVISVIPSGGDDPSKGSPYMIAGDTKLYISDDDGESGDESPVTGIRVNAGATLTLGLNISSSGNTGQDTAKLDISGDVRISGTLTTKDLTTGTVKGGVIDHRHGAPAIARDRGGLSINAGLIVVGNTGKIDTGGGDAPSTGEGRGGDGGSVELTAAQDGIFLDGGSIDTSGGNGNGSGDGGSGGRILLLSENSIINSAIMSSSGGNGSSGGDPGYIEMDAASAIYNTASLTSNGGNGSTGIGGSADNTGGIFCYSSVSGIYNSGVLITQGGNGFSGGGNGGSIELYGADDMYTGDVINSGSFSTNGGNALSSGNGGQAGEITVSTYGGSIRTSASVAANGGTGAVGGGRGGDAGVLAISSSAGRDYFYSEEIAPGPVRIAGDISLSGGTGANGGDGGQITVQNRYSSDDARQTGTIEFVGYKGEKGISLNGGNGKKGGGMGGAFFAFTESSIINGNVQPAGSVVNDIAVHSKGGNSLSSGDGGSGGIVVIEAEGSASSENTVVINSGDMDVSGGNGIANGGDSGGVSLYGHALIKNTALIIASGGYASGAGGAGGAGAGDSLEFISSYDVLNHGKIIAVGGNGSGTGASGGNVGDIIMYAGNRVTNSGSVSANGGNAKGAAKNGNGGTVDLFSEKAATDNHGTLISVVRGSGGGKGTGINGHILIDWVDITPQDGTLP